MRAHDRGGILLVVPAGSSVWQESIVGPVPYAIEPPYTELAELMRQSGVGPLHEWQDAVRHAVEATPA